MKKLLLALLLCMNAHATLNGWVPNPDMVFTFDHLQGVPSARKYMLGKVLREAHTTAICVYDFATQGGAVGVVKLLATDLIQPCLLPGKSIVRGGFMDVTTAVTSGGSATISVSSGSTAGDMLGVTAISPTFASVGRAAVTSPTWATASTFIKLPNANTITLGVNLNAYQPYFTVGTAALTAGHVRLFIDYETSE